MKKIFFSLLLLSAFALTADAQSSNCAKSCAAKKGAAAASCQSKVSTASVVIAPEHQAAAAKLASMDASIEARKNETGGVSYVKKETCGYSGSVSYVSLGYDPATNTFVNVAPSELAPAAKSSTGCGPSKATSANGKACCASGSAAKAGCCASKAKTASATSASSLEAKPVKTSGGTKN
jgi:hypothetical protein